MQDASFRHVGKRLFFEESSNRTGRPACPVMSRCDTGYPPYLRRKPASLAVFVADFALPLPLCSHKPLSRVAEPASPNQAVAPVRPL